jgi:hypothetical protein
MIFAKVDIIKHAFGRLLPKRCRQQSEAFHKASGFLDRRSDMKKIIATAVLLMFVSIAFAGKAGYPDNVINSDKRYALCHDERGKFNPQSKDCDPNSCGCLFHQIEEFLLEIFG